MKHADGRISAKNAIMTALVVAAGHGTEGYVRIPAEVRRGYGADRVGPERLQRGLQGRVRRHRIQTQSGELSNPSLQA